MPWVLAQAAASAASEQALTASLSRTKSPAKKPKLSSPSPYVLHFAFVFADDFGDVFEAGQALEAFNSECFRDSVDQSGRYDGFDDVLLAVEPSQIAPALDQVIGQQCAGLIAVKQYILPVFI